MPARYCAQCGTPLVAGPVEGRERQYCPACGYIVFRNPVPVGMAVVEQAGQLLLIRRANPPLQGYWAPPAGHIEIDESVEAGTLRETQEEAGVLVRLEALLGVYSQAEVGVLIIAYAGQVVGGTARAGEDAVEVGYFARGQLPSEPAPANGTVLDKWFHGVLQSILAPWQAPSASV